MGYTPKSQRSADSVAEKGAKRIKLITDMEMLLNISSQNDWTLLLEAAMYSAGVAISAFAPHASGARAFIQDFAAALNRRGLLPNDKVEEFTEYGYKYMETL